MSARSDLLGGKGQRGDEPRGDPAPRKPGRQEDEAHHHRLAAGLRPAHGEPFPAGLAALRGRAEDTLPASPPGWAWSRRDSPVLSSVAMPERRDSP